MKYWLSHLPLEVWVDCYRYPWISRRKLARIVHRFRNRRYTEYLQFYLHDWGKRKLERLWIDWKGLYKYVQSGRLYLDYPPLTPIPDNIKSIQFISIDRFDARTLQFLHQIGRLLTEMKVRIFFGEPCLDRIENLRVVLTYLVPLLNGIDSLDCNVCYVPTVRQCFDDELTKIKWLSVCHYEEIAMDQATKQTTLDFVMDWLKLPEHNGPKLCDAIICNGNAFGQQICSAIREEFLMAKTPRTFAVIFYSAWNWDFAEFHLQNNIDEELHGVQFGSGDRFGEVHITRHRTNCANELQEWIKGVRAPIDCNLIHINNPAIGSMDAPENEEVDQQPSTSKKA